MRTTNNFLVVPRIIFNTSIENYFFIVLRIIFRCIANLFLVLQCFAGLAVEVDWFESLTSLGDHFENFASGGVFSKRMPRRNIVRELKRQRFSSFLQNLSGASNLCRSWWGFLDRRFNRGDYEGTSRLVHNSNPYSEHDMSARLNCALPGLVLKSSSRTTHAGFRNEDAENECPLPWSSGRNSRF